MKGVDVGNAKAKRNHSVLVGRVLAGVGCGAGTDRNKRMMSVSNHLRAKIFDDVGHAEVKGGR